MSEPLEFDEPRYDYELARVEQPLMWEVILWTAVFAWLGILTGIVAVLLVLG